MSCLRNSGRHGTWSLRSVASLAIGLSVALGLAACGNEESSSQGNASPSQGSIPYRTVNGGKTLVGPGGQRIPIRPKAIVGFADSVTPEGEVVNVTGWAAAGNLSGPAARVVGVVDTSGIAQTKPYAQRPDVVEAYGAPGIEKSGFTLFVETSALECSAPAGGLTVFAIADGAAGPLTLVGNSEGELDETC